jgi:hypothetical protein
LVWGRKEDNYVLILKRKRKRTIFFSKRAQKAHPVFFDEHLLRTQLPLFLLSSLSKCFDMAVCLTAAHARHRQEIQSTKSKLAGGAKERRHHHYHN